ncbi:regulator of G-protein signaling 1 isoform X1 [Amborella trichopoda]|uniref:regulator of G-protein signaling 1 isoform X1 n=2 Tax=Amborella trichopoda TaxID=13333 RepID=UPI0009BD547D|nr:regulator of G-protein signaling 1 isoform X1 [Amborella trichopoda]|eukprot:XP_020527667.1 regulator of G-protein signaling 1 isoform X1 [Amborella trichopoda]
MANCSVLGGCPSDYIAIAISILCMILLFARAAFPYAVHKPPKLIGSNFILLFVQILASFCLLLSLVMSVQFFKFKRKHPWQSCYIWAVWGEGPCGFGLLLSCRILQAYHLYYLFVKRRLPPLNSRILLPLILLPWIAAAAFIHQKRPLNPRCHMHSRWVIPIGLLHVLYVSAMVGFTWAVRHVEFRFHEFRALLRGIIVSSTAVALTLVHPLPNCRSRHLEHRSCEEFGLLLTLLMSFMKASIMVLAFFSLSISQPLLSQMSLRKKEPQDFGIMGRALGIPASGLLLPTGTTMDIDLKEPIDRLLMNKRFRNSFMAFADSCMAGESIHFYDEVHELGKIPVGDTITRIYMARHIIEHYIVNGSAMEVNISHKTRQEILGTTDLAHPDLFNHAISELMQLIKMNLERDYWSSTFFFKFKEETKSQAERNDLMECSIGWDYSPRLSAVHGADDPFHHDPLNKSSSDRGDFSFQSESAGSTQDFPAISLVGFDGLSR